MTTIDLLALAKRAEETYRDVECSFGKVRVYHVPDVRFMSANLSRSEPEIPTVRMKTATGHQDRAAKQGDKVYSEYLVERDNYYKDLLKLRGAINAVEALKDIDWSKYDLSSPPPVESAQAMYNGNWPDNEFLRKRAWLDWTYFYFQKDQEIILGAINEMRGVTEPTESDVDEVKKNSGSSSKQGQKN